MHCHYQVLELIMTASSVEMKKVQHKVIMFQSFTSCFTFTSSSHTSLIICHRWLSSTIQTKTHRKVLQIFFDMSGWHVKYLEMMTQGLCMMQRNDATDADKWAKDISRRQLILLMALLLLFAFVARLLTT